MGIPQDLLIVHQNHRPGKEREGIMNPNRCKHEHEISAAIERWEETGTARFIQDDCAAVNPLRRNPKER